MYLLLHNANEFAWLMRNSWHQFHASNVHLHQSSCKAFLQVFGQITLSDSLPMHPNSADIPPSLCLPTLLMPPGNKKKETQETPSLM